MERASGIEPPSNRWQRLIIATIRRPHSLLCRESESNTRHEALQATALPLSYRGVYFFVGFEDVCQSCGQQRTRTPNLLDVNQVL